MFKPNPKAQVSLTFDKLFGRGVSHSVTGARLTPLQCKAHGYPRDTYLTELFVDGQLVATARNHDWRRAYKLLKAEVEKLYADGATFGP